MPESPEKQDRRQRSAPSLRVTDPWTTPPRRSIASKDLASDQPQTLGGALKIKRTNMPRLARLPDLRGVRCKSGDDSRNSTPLTVVEDGGGRPVPRRLGCKPLPSFAGAKPTRA